MPTRQKHVVLVPGLVETPENLELMRLIDEEYTQHPFYGSRQLRKYAYDFSSSFDFLIHALG